MANKNNNEHNKEQREKIDFNPIFKKLEEENEKELKELTIKEPPIKAEVTKYEINEGVLSIENLLRKTEFHQKDNDNCHRIQDIIYQELERKIEKMSIDELINLSKLVQTRESYNTDVEKQNYLIILKTEVSKKILLSSGKEFSKMEKDEKLKANTLMQLFKETNEKNKTDG